MLVLSRKKSECICIGGGIEVHVVDLSRNRVRLGITAPPEVPIHRGEIHFEVQTKRGVLSGIGMTEEIQ